MGVNDSLEGIEAVSRVRPACPWFPEGVVELVLHRGLDQCDGWTMLAILVQPCPLDGVLFFLGLFLFPGLLGSSVLPPYPHLPHR